MSTPVDPASAGIFDLVKVSGIRQLVAAFYRQIPSDELLGLMRDSGCQQVLIGLESPPVLRSRTAEGGRRASLDGVELKSNWKSRQQDSYREAIAKIQSYGVTVNGCFILGLDGDTPAVFDNVLDFVRLSGLYEVQVTFQTAFPGTPDPAKVCLKEGFDSTQLYELVYTAKDPLVLGIGYAAVGTTRGTVGERDYNYGVAPQLLAQELAPEDIDAHARQRPARKTSPAPPAIG